VSNDIEHLHNSVKANSLLGDYLLFKSQGIKDLESRKKVSVKAIKYYKQALKLLPSYSKGHNNLAVLYNELGDYKNAQYHAQRGLNKGNLTKHNYFNLAVANHYSDNIAEAEQAYLKTIAMDSTYLTAYTQLAKLYHESETTDKALAITARMLPVFPEKQQEILHQGQQLAMSAYGDKTMVFIDLLHTNGYIDQALYDQFKNELEK
jgi:predicted Zn-dependent protease